MPDDVLTADPEDQLQTATDATDEPPALVPPATEELSFEPDANAPYGYMIDPVTKQRRPRIKAGRSGKPKAAPPPPLETLTKIKGTADDDRPPSRPKKTSSAGNAKEPFVAPPFRAGPIASGMNKLYGRAGKVVRVWDHDIGSAIIAITRKESDDDTTVGEAWEEIARTNPRIRAFLHRLLEGGAWSGLFMAHLPILLAILMKDGIRRRLPFGNLLSSLLDPDEDGPSEVSDALGGINGMDMQQMMAAAINAFPDMMAGLNMPRTPTAPTYQVYEDGSTPDPTVTESA